ncbi:VirB8/TrbF family protein [Mesorhizobium sp. WSM2239]|uniref:Type IV secretion system protein virB8 n=2 Tax=unclassified Mesorhizobium TaxID=325217 RepID=A0AAU8DGX3_9HYPH
MSNEPTETGVVDQRYFQQGKSWEDDTHRSLRRSRTFAWLLTGVFGAIALLSLVALVLLFPLKQYEPYMVAVDKTTGYLEIARALKPGDLSQDEAVTAANIVRYIRARETYDPRMIKSNFDLAQLYSTGSAADDLVREFTPSNPSSKDKRYGTDTTISVTVKSVSFLNRTTATVRLSTEEKRQNTTRREHWVAVVKFRYTSTPLKNEYRFDNPLGFQVAEYRRDQESLPDATPADRTVQ